MLRVAVPNKGALAERASDMLTEAGYRQRHEPRDLTVLDTTNDVEFFFLRPKDIAIYVAPVTWISASPAATWPPTPAPTTTATPSSSCWRWASARRPSATRGLAAPTGRSPTSRASASPPRTRSSWAATSRPAASPPTVIRLDGAVEISIQLGVADLIADVVGSGRTLRQHDLVPFGDPICESEAVLIHRNGSELSAAKKQLTARIQGVVFAQQYLMLDYDCPRSILDGAIALTPGLESPTVAPLANPDWVAVRAMVSRKEANKVMDELAAIGAKAVLASDIRFCRL